MRIKLLTTGAVVTALLTTGLLTGPAEARPGDAPTAEDVGGLCAVPADRDLNVTEIVLRVARGLGVSDRVLLAGFEAGWVESHMNNLDCGDSDSLGVFQQRPSQGWGTPEQIMDVAYASNSFLTRAVRSEQAHPGYTAGQIAQDVQRSAFPERYDQAEAKARQLLAEARSIGSTVNDVSGDGYADLVATKADGTLWYLPNNTNPDHRPYTDSTQIGTGFEVFTRIA